ncbi:hypothetical protein GCM10010272_69640 [Streptomyces lateritius]|nr:hypothetical protein GCM10010272_69640 [Streptomyces lateritius]
MPEYGDFLDSAERHSEVRLDTTPAFTDFNAFVPFPEGKLTRLADVRDRFVLGAGFPKPCAPAAGAGGWAAGTIGCGPSAATTGPGCCWNRGARGRGKGLPMPSSASAGPWF